MIIYLNKAILVVTLLLVTTFACLLVLPFVAMNWTRLAIKRNLDVEIRGRAS